MKLGAVSFGMLVTLAGASSAHAFETHTHAYITYQAHNASVLGGSGPESQALKTALGLDRLATDLPFAPYWLSVPIPLGAYYDNLPSGASPESFVRPVGAHEWWQM